MQLLSTMAESPDDDPWITLPTSPLTIAGFALVGAWTSWQCLHVASTVGAGDTFVGTFGAFKLKGFEDARALYLANIAAAIKTTREETRASPTYEEIQKYVNDQDSCFQGNSQPPITLDTSLHSIFSCQSYANDAMARSRILFLRCAASAPVTVSGAMQG